MPFFVALFFFPLSDILAPTHPQHGDPSMSSFIKNFQRGYRLIAQPQHRTSPRSIRFPYLDGIPQATPRDQLTKRLIKQILLTLTVSLISGAIWGTGSF